MKPKARESARVDGHGLAKTELAGAEDGGPTEQWWELVQKRIDSSGLNPHCEFMRI